MNVVLLSPHFPPQFYLFAQALRRHGHTVLGIGDQSLQSLPRELQSSVNAWYQVESLDHYDEVLRAFGFLVHGHGRIDRVDSLNEHWLDLEARLREDFNVPGPRPEQVRRHRSKSGMRAVFQAHDIPCSTGERVQSPAQVRAFVEKHGLPVVFKPDTGVGAARTFKAKTREEVEAAIAENLPDYVVEKFEPGRLTSFDGLADREGRIVYCTSHLYSAGIMDIVNERPTMHYWSRRELPPALEELGRRTVAAFEVRERFFHLEFFENDDGSYRALEVNLRPPGGFTTDLMNYGADLDVYDLWARVLSGDDLSSFTYERRYHVAHVGRRRDARYELGVDALRRELGATFLLSRPMPEVLSGAMGNEMVLLRHEDEATLFEGIRLATR